jgi:hypothetical protein
MGKAKTEQQTCENKATVVRKWIGCRGIEKLGNAHKILFLTTNEIVYLILILTLKLTKIASFEVIIVDGYVGCRFTGWVVVRFGRNLLMFWVNVLLNFPSRKR